MQSSSQLVASEEYLKVLHIGEIAFSFYQHQRSVPSQDDYNQWLGQLSAEEQQHYQVLDYPNSKNLLSFRVYFREKLNREMVAYMKENLSAQDFELWQDRRHTPAS